MATREWNITLAVLLGISFHHGASGQLRMTPDNTAGVVGTSVVLHCQGSVDAPLGGIFWNEYITSSHPTSIAYNEDVIADAPNSQLYSITGDSSVAKYHLNIELTMISGGRYECNEPFSRFSALAHVTVLQSAPVCSDTIPADGVVEEGDTITFSCEVVYNSTSIDWPPVMTWTGPDGTITDVNKLSTTGGTVTSSANVTGTPGLNGGVYSVRTHFEAYVGSLPADHATNVPSYSHSHSFDALHVYYSPRDIAFQPDGNTFNPGDRLTCSADGNPAVSYTWYNSTNNSTLADGAELTIREEMDGLMCGCEAYNTIRGTKRSVSKEITLTVTKAPTTTTTTTSSTPATSSQGPTADTCASGQLRMTPDNTAGVVGTSVVLHCQGSVDVPPGGIFWSEFITSTTHTNIIYNGDIVPGAPNSQLYSITGDSTLAQYHLNIKLAYLSGGRYECYQGFQILSAKSHVTVLESAPFCIDTIKADGVLEEGETITYTCEVAYNSTSIDWPPVMTWTGPDGTITDVIRLSTLGGTVTSSVDVTGAPGLNGAVYSVRTHFEAYVGSLPADHATNVPTYSYLHSFNALQVHYSPRDIAFQPCGNTFNPSDRLTCSADGNPTVSYIWYNSTDNTTLADGPELTITLEMDGLKYGCEAYNTIRGIKHSISKEITLTVNEATESTTTEALTPSTCSGPSPGVVAGIVIAVILLLGLLVVSSLLLWRTRNTPCEKCKEMLNQPHPAKSNSCNGVYETPNTSGITGQSSEYTELSFT